VKYVDLSADPKRVDGSSLPWALAVGHGDSLDCPITVDDDVKDGMRANGVRAVGFCQVISA
jgi:Mycobacterium membrane protein